MTQPTFTDGPPVPLMVEGLLDTAAIQHYFTDLATAATVVSILEKGAPTTYGCDSNLSLESVRDRLLTGEARAIQLRYQFDNRNWTDTILRTPTGFRVVRCQHEADGGEQSDCGVSSEANKSRSAPGRA